MNDENMNDLAKKWAGKIAAAEKKYDEYYSLVDETRESYKAEQKNFNLGGMTKGAYNIFWSGIETQKPFLYFKQPKPYIDRVNKSAGKEEALACCILERALEWCLGSFDFDAKAKYARNDYLISGCGILWEEYKPELTEIVDDEGNTLEFKTGETVVSEYINPKDFVADVDHVGVWEDVTWVAKKIYMTKSDAIKNFGEEVRDMVVSEDEKDYETKQICIYEIWDKNTKSVLWLWKGDTSRFLKVSDDPLHLDGFFPLPKPIFATQTNDSIIPVPDYVMIKADLEELAGVIERMRLTMKALKVTGAYDSSFSNLANILNKDVSLLAVADFEKLKDAGGLRGVLDFMPIDQYITALQALAKRRDDIIKSIYDLTGVSDIMRGNSNAAETATAVTKKTNFGTLRNQDRQNDMQRFIRDLYRLKAEIICEQFSTETLMRFVPAAQMGDVQTVQRALALLKKDKMLGMVLSVETEEIFNQEQESKKTLEAVQTITKMVNDAFQLVSAQPKLLPLYRQMVSSIVTVMPHSRPFEAVLEQVFGNIEQELSKPKPQPKPQPNPELQLQAQKNQQDYEIKKEQNRLKAREVELKEREQAVQTSLTNKEMNLQANLKAAGIAAKQDVDSNITTGLVRGF